MKKERDKKKKGKEKRATQSKEDSKPGKAKISIIPNYSPGELPKRQHDEDAFAQYADWVEVIMARNVNHGRWVRLDRALQEPQRKEYGTLVY